MTKRTAVTIEKRLVKYKVNRVQYSQTKLLSYYDNQTRHQSPTNLVAKTKQIVKVKQKYERELVYS